MPRATTVTNTSVLPILFDAVLKRFCETIIMSASLPTLIEPSIVSRRSRGFPAQCGPHNHPNRLILDDWQKQEGREKGASRLSYFLSGLFMSVIYSTINSKEISCFREAEYGAIAGAILFFTCAAAGVRPLAMGAISDSLCDPKYASILATGFAGLLFASLLLNWIINPTRQILHELDAAEYHVGEIERGA